MSEFTFFRNPQWRIERRGVEWSMGIGIEDFIFALLHGHDRASRCLKDTINGYGNQIKYLALR